MKYWEGLYSRNQIYKGLDADSKDAIKKALKGLRFKKSILEKKMLSVDLAILVLKKRNATWSFGVRSKKEIAKMRGYFLT